jgi:hypothetical protein
MNDLQKVIVFIVALMCNFTFLATAQTQSHTPTEEAKKLPECIRSHGPDSMETRRNMAYFQEHWKKKNYPDAYTRWTYVFNNAPCSYKSIHQLGPQLLAILINNTNNIERKNRLIDTLMMIFPARIKYFGEESYIKGSWAFYMSKYQPGRLPEIISLYAFYFEHQKDRIDDRYVRDYMRQSILAYQQSLYTKEQVCNIYQQLRDTASNYYQRNLETPQLSESWQSAINYIDSIVAEHIKCAVIGPARKTGPCQYIPAIHCASFGKVFASYTVNAS